jgi:putative ABC transport system permease protein
MLNPSSAKMTNTQMTIRLLGGEALPNCVKIYVKDFDSKDIVTAYLDAWNDSVENDSDEITYTDTVAVMMSLVRSMLDAVTYVLVAFTAISLVVSSVMIGVITYVSVVERTKEIGVLRSLGARKRDIRNLFNAETFLIGLFAGAIGVGITYLLSIPINLLLKHFTGIGTLAALPPYQAFIMVCISVALTLISGLIPAQSAARKDPVIALRTE